LRAFAQVLEEWPNAVLLVVGEPLFTAADQQYFLRLKQTAYELGVTSQVRFLGAQRDVPAVLQALDLLVVNSLAEPCGLVVLEGMASAVPVIATAVGGNPEMIQHALSGWLVPAQNESALAVAIVKLGASPLLRQRLGRKARSRVSEQFTTGAYLAALEEFYHRCSNQGEQEKMKWTQLQARSAALSSNEP
jgi:glycosyltransferase involved in cell wall biosynthesis